MAQADTVAVLDKLEKAVKSLPTLRDAHGDKAVSQVAVLKWIEVLRNAE